MRSRALTLRSLVTVALCLAILSSQSKAQIEYKIYPAPDFGRGDVWIDQGASTPHHISDYRGHVVLIDFWEYTCINCIRDFAVLKRWYARYHPFGFDVIGVHYGEYQVGFQVENVRDAVQRFQLPWPVVADQDGSAWKAYGASGWPMRYLIDPAGQVLMQVFGERGNRELEGKIRALISATHPEVANVQPDGGEDDFKPDCGITTPETFLGTKYGHSATGNLGDHHAGDEADFVPPHSPADGTVMLAGRWLIEQDGVNARSHDTSAEVRFHARSLYAVLSLSGPKEVRVNLFQDGASMPKDTAGGDVKFDSKGAFIEVTEARMYYLERGPTFSAHLIALQPEAAGVRLHSFTYGNNCQLNDKP